jgi:hypothetical protein
MKIGVPFAHASLAVQLEGAHKSRRRAYDSIKSLSRIRQAFREIPEREPQSDEGKHYTELELALRDERIAPKNVQRAFACQVCQYEGKHYTPDPFRLAYLFRVKHLCPPCFQRGLPVEMAVHAP